MMEKLRAAIIGCGTWGHGHARVYAADPRVEITALCDQAPGKAQSLRDEMGLTGALTFTDYREMLEKAPIDIVSIVTPDFAHADACVCCAEHGKHMLIEKPLATNPTDLDRMTRAIEKNGVRVMVDFHNRWNPPFAEMKRDILTGVSGRPCSGYIRLNDQKWVATKMLPWAAKSSILWFLGSHAVDTLRWLFESEVDTVYALSREGILKGEGVDTADMYQYSLKFKNGCVAQVENGWICPDTSPNVNDYKCNILCEKGMYNLDLSEHGMLRRYTADAATVPDLLVNMLVRGVPMGFAYQSIAHFVDAVYTGKPFYVTLEDAKNVSKTIFAVLESAASGQIVRVRLD